MMPVPLTANANAGHQPLLLQLQEGFFLLICVLADPPPPHTSHEVGGFYFILLSLSTCPLAGSCDVTLVYSIISMYKII